MATSQTDRHTNRHADYHIPVTLHVLRITTILYLTTCRLLGPPKEVVSKCAEAVEKIQVSVKNAPCTCTVFPRINAYPK